MLTRPEVSRPRPQTQCQGRECESKFFPVNAKVNPVFQFRVIFAVLWKNCNNRINYVTSQAFMTTTWHLKCWNSMHIHNNSVLRYLYNMAVGLVIYSKARVFKANAKAKAKAKSSRPRPENPKAKTKAKAKKFGLKAKAKAKD